MIGQGTRRSQYDLTEQQEMLRDMAHSIAERHIAPRAAEIDRTGEFPWDVVDVYREHGLFGLHVPEEYGGAGVDPLAFCVVVEELARVDATCALILAVQQLGVLPLILAGNEEQKRRYLPRLASGEWLTAFALTEPEAGSDPGSLVTSAVRRGDGYVLNGSKRFITNGGVAEFYSVFARTGPGEGNKGISAFIVEKGFPGFKVGRYEDKLGIKGSPTAELHFDECLVPAENLLGQEGDGFGIAMMTLDRTRVNIAAQAVGIAQGAFECALNYAKERRQFGKPIASFEGIQFMLADMATQIEAARQLTYRCAAMIGEHPEPRLPAEVNRTSAMAKLFASDVAMRVTVDAVQILGGYGYTKEFPAERMMRDAKITQIYEGTNEIQRLVIARSYLR